MNKKLFGTLVASSVIGALSASSVFAADAKKDANASHFCSTNCKGKSACKAHGNEACAGKNECKGNGFIKAKNEKACAKSGGVWTAEATAPAADATTAAPGATDATKTK